MTNSLIEATIAGDVELYASLFLRMHNLQDPNSPAFAKEFLNIFCFQNEKILAHLYEIYCPKKSILGSLFKKNVTQPLHFWHELGLNLSFREMVSNAVDFSAWGNLDTSYSSNMLLDQIQDRAYSMVHCDQIFLKTGGIFQEPRYVSNLSVMTQINEFFSANESRQEQLFKDKSFNLIIGSRWDENCPLRNVSLGQALLIFGDTRYWLSKLTYDSPHLHNGQVREHADRFERNQALVLIDAAALSSAKHSEFKQQVNTQPQKNKYGEEGVASIQSIRKAAIAATKKHPQKQDAQEMRETLKSRISTTPKERIEPTIQPLDPHENSTHPKAEHAELPAEFSIPDFLGIKQNKVSKETDTNQKKEVENPVRHISEIVTTGEADEYISSKGYKVPTEFAALRKRN